jgi:flavin reductase (DIM6/NTAB) family NADH-FMN oxidoreductase RutF
MTSSAFDDLVGSANAALLVVTTAVDDVKAGCLVGYHNQSSMSPRQYSFWLSKANHTYRVGLLATHFVVHFLTEHDYDVAERFAATSGQDTDKFADLSVETDEYGLPLITALPNRMVVERLTMLDDGGDHVCVTAGVLTAESDGHFTALRTADVGKLKPAHSAVERIIEP